MPVRILFAALPAYGHLYPVMPLASAAAAAGHEVAVASGAPFAGRLPLPTVLQHPPGQGLEPAVGAVYRREPNRKGFEFAVSLFAEELPAVTAPMLVAELESFRPDVVVYEAMNAGAGIAADLLGIPAAALGICLWQPFIPATHRRAIARHERLWAERGRSAPTASALLADRYLDPFPAALQGADLPDIPNRVALRSVGWAEGLDRVPRWLSGPRRRPRVYVTLGTVSFRAVDVFRRVLDDLAHQDVDVLVTVGPEGDPALLGPVPANVHLERYLPQPAVLPFVDLMVSHGGSGTVLGALAHGLPQLVLPQGADHFANADALSASGAGRVLLREEQVPGAIGAAVSGMLGASQERAAAARLQRAIADAPAPQDVLGVLEDLAASRSLVGAR